MRIIKNNFDIREGLILHYPFNQNVKDTVSNNDATVLNATLTTDKYGISNNAYNFDASGDQIYRQGIVEINSSNIMSVSIWFYPRTLGETGFARILSFRDNAIANLGFEVYLRTSSTIRYTFVNYGIIDSSVGTVNLNAWNHLVITKNGLSMGLYLNNVLIGTTTSTGINTLPTSENWNIGNGLGVTRCFDGKLDNFRVYNRVLTSDEVSTIYKNYL